VQRVLQEIIGQFLDVRGHGGGEKQRLTPARKALYDPADIRQEAHVEHVIRFVKDQDLNLGQIQGTAVNVIQEPPRASGDDVDPITEELYLSIDIDAAVNGGALETGLPAQ